MKAKAQLLLLVSVLLATALGHAQNQQSQVFPRGQQTSESSQKVRRKAEQAPDRLLVRFRGGTRSERAAAVHARVGSSVRRSFRTVPGLSVVHLPRGLAVGDAIRSYRQNPEVLYAGPDYILRIDQNQSLPNESLFSRLWGLHNTGQSTGFPFPPGAPDADIDAPEAWGITTGSLNVVIGVIDTGIDYTHVDLAANMFRNEVECTPNGVDNDGNGYIDDCYGIDTFNHDSNPMDDHDHGTHVAGTIGAVGNNGIGVVGVNWTVRLAACKFIGADGWGLTSDAIECLDYFASLRDRGVNIVATNNSWGGAGFDQPLVDAINQHRLRDILFVASAGNTGGDADVGPSYPAAYDLPNIISVAATNQWDGLASFSTYGRLSVDVGAPGVAIFSTKLNNSYGDLSGTSMAAPHVTGVVALLKAADSSRNGLALKNLILTGGDDLPSLAGKTLTGKRLNGYGALTCTDRTLQVRLQPATPAIIVPPGTSIPLVFLSLKCANVFGPVQVSVAETGQVIDLRDDGVAPDTQAGDGIFAADFTPSGIGGYRLSFPNGDTLVVSAEPGYNYQPATYNYRNIAGTSLDLTDDSFATLSLPFAIQFGNAPHSTLHVGSNGIVSFRAGIAEFRNAPLPAPIDDAIVAPFWDDLYPSPGNVFYEVLGSAPNRELVIEWRDISGYNCSFDEGARFQVVFSEASSDVLFQYADVDFGAGCDDVWPISGGAFASVGIQLGPEMGTQFSFHQPSLSDGLALLWTMTGDNPVPLINGTAPANAPAGSGDFALNVDGTGFVYASEILWNGAAKPTTRVSGGRLSASISGAEIATPGSVQLTVRNPAPGGGESAAHLFDIGPPASLTITAPNGGGTWQAGVPQTVAWTFAGDPGPTLSIELFRREGEKAWTQRIASGVPVGASGSGSFAVTLSVSLMPGNYRLRLRSEAFPGLEDTSDAEFSVAGPVTLLSPNGGESWAAGSTQTISWTYSDLASLGCTEMIIELWGPAGYQIASVPLGTNGSGSYTWTLHDGIPGGSDYRIHIFAGYDWGGGDCPGDLSDSPFTIVGDPNGTRITLTSPNGGETWQIGAPQTITWTYSGDTGPNVCILLVKRNPPETRGCYDYGPIGSNGSGSYLWDFWDWGAIPPGDDYRIVVRSVDYPFVEDTSDADFSIGAAPAQHTLTVVRAGSGAGTVTSNPAGIDCGATCSASFTGGTGITLTATPAAGSTFAGWSGACSGTGPCSLTMDAAKTVTATFDTAPPNQFTLTVNRAGSGAGTVTSNSAGIDCGATCSALFASGTVVTLTATPAGGSIFSGWGGACTGSGPCSLAMDAARAVTATFNLQQEFSFGTPPAARTVAAGQSAQFALQVTGQPGFTGSVTFACSPPLPQGVACSFNPPSVSPGNGTAASTLTVTTTSRTLAMSVPTSIGVFACWLLPLGLLFVSPARRSRPSSRAGWVALFAVVVMVGLVVACGGGDSRLVVERCPPICPVNQLGTPSGTYAITVTATSGGVSQAQAVTLVVN